MGNYTSLSSLFEATASAIRIKLGTSDLIAANSFPEKIAAIPTGAAVSGTTSLTVDKSTYNVSQYSNAYVDVIDHLNQVAITENISATTVGAAYVTSIDSSDYVSYVEVGVDPVSLSGNSSAILSGNSVQLISGGVAISTINGTSTAIVPAGTTNITTNSSQHNVSAYQYANVNVTPQSAKATVYNQYNNSNYNLGGFYNSLDIKGYDYKEGTVYCGTSQKNFRTPWNGSGDNRYYATVTIPTSFYCRGVYFIGASNGTTCGYMTPTANKLVVYVAYSNNMTDWILGSYTEYYSDSAIENIGTSSAYFKPESSVYFPSGLSSQKFFYVLIGTYKQPT